MLSVVYDPTMIIYYNTNLTKGAFNDTEHL